MDRNILRKYAPQARRDFIAAVTDRAGNYGLTKKKCDAVTFQGDVALIGGRPYPASIGRLQQRLAERIGREGFDAVMEAVAYTWFNRFVAIRYMELHGYLDHGYRVLSHPEGKTVPEILEQAEHVALPGLNRSRVIDLKLAGNQDNELYRMLLVAQCNALSTAMPFLFEHIDDETELLLPENLLHSDSLLRKLVRDVPEENWQEIEVLGWLYQFYISEKKDQVIGKVVKTEDIPAATQLFTPNWIVKYLVQNSIGRKWLQAYPESGLRGKMAYFVEGECLGDRGQGAGDRENRNRNMRRNGTGGCTNERGQELSGSDRMAEGNGPGGIGVSSNQEFSEGGTLRTHQSTSPGGGVHSIEYRGGTCEEIESGVSELSVHLTGKPRGSGDATVHSASSGICGEGNNHSGIVSSQRNTSDDKHYSGPPEKQLNARPPVPCPLSPAPSPLNPESLTLLDPACGSGHILVEAYDLFKAMYQERGYRAKDIPRLILANNLFGLEIDARAAQLASFALIMKARADDRNVLQGGIRMNIRCIQSSDGIKAEEVYEALTGVDVIDKSGLPPADDFFEEDTAPLFAHLRNQSMVESRNAGTDPSHSVRLRQSPHSSSPAPSPSPLVPSSPLSPDPCPLTPSSLRHLLSLFHGDAARTFGSLIRIPGELAKLLPELVDRTDRLVHGNDLTRQRVAERFAPIAEQAWLLGRQYDAVVANPPYMGTKGMNSELKAFAVKAFPEGKSDLCTMFILRGLEMVNHNGYNAMVTMQSWMFLSSYEKMREKILDETTLICMAHMANMVMGIAFGTAATVWHRKHYADYKGAFCFVEYEDIGPNEIPIAFPPKNERNLKVNIPNNQESDTSLPSSLPTSDSRLTTSSPSSLSPDPCPLTPSSSLAPSPYPLIPNFHRAAAEDFKKIPGSPIAYWATNSQRTAFVENRSIGHSADVVCGMTTGDNSKFVRCWHEVNVQKFGHSLRWTSDKERAKYKWFAYNKGGQFRKWYGNNDDVVNWEDSGREILESGRAYPRARNKYFQDSITWSFVSSSYFGVRHSDSKAIFDMAGCSAFPPIEDMYFLTALLCSNATHFFLKLLNPTLNFQVGNISSLPFPTNNPALHKNATETASKAIQIAKQDWNSHEISWDFTTLPLLRPEHYHPTLRDTYAHLRAHWMEMTLEMQRLEEENNRLFIEAYGLQEELTPEVPLEEITLTCNPYYRFKEGGRGQGTGDREEEVVSRESLVAREEEEVVSRESLVVSEGTQGLSQARNETGLSLFPERDISATGPSSRGFPVNERLEARLLTETIKELVSYAVGCMMGRYSLDVPGLVYAHSGNEGFDPGKYTTFPADGDGIVPVTETAWFEDDAAERFFKFIGIRGQGAGAREEEGARDEGLGTSTPDPYALSASPYPLAPSPYLEEDLDFIADALGRRKNETARETIRRYFATGFYKDHVQTYKRRPIYWLFSSGRLRAFQCLVYLHRYNEGTLARMRTEYVIPLQGRMAARLEHLAGDLVAAGTTSQRNRLQREQDTLRKQLDELRAFDENLRHFADLRITLDLDDGVKVNYGKFGELLGEVKAVTGGTGEESS